MRTVFGNLADSQIAETVRRPVLLHGVAVVSRQSRRVKRKPDVAEVVLRHFLDAGGGKRIDLIARCEMPERKFLRRKWKRDEEKGEKRTRPPRHRRSLPSRN